MASSVGTHLFNALRGGLIGTAEVVPGVSGGTIALIVGVYDRLIISAGHVLTGLRYTVSDVPRGRGTRRAGEQFRSADWPVVLAVLAGMVAAVLLAAQFLAPVAEDNEQRAHALFFGLVAASLWVPYSGSGRRWRPAHYLLALVVAAVVFVLTGLPSAQADPAAPVVALAAAVAVCALVLPGMSGAFILLTLGLLDPTMDALRERDLGYVATFALGALVGLAAFVKLLQWLLEHYHHLTLVVMTGLMLGSLRALWPWSDDERTLRAPEGDVAMTVTMAAIGFVVVVVILLIGHRVGATQVPGGGAGGDARGGRHARAESSH
ncbi:putative membrane protein [Haloactinopolyspora alba]|uniref:Putative membrane protein n=1 Tax=Haloactinopolyspora alba TaxID=648780 RepID=A0A2P8DVC0_9ACTN|nr:DUF368 domain-containing protein [Haloactinopolyspora alba]PSL01183.1 putative membrane protein [Haloactinopolyspora alba]